jgi:Flp pilus assembly protein TadB
MAKILRLKNLFASDFPGIDEAKFNEWTALKIKKNRERRIALYIGLGILLILSVVSVLTARPIFLAIFVILLVIDDLIFFSRRRYRRLRQLGEELKMSARLKAKKRGEVFAG